MLSTQRRVAAAAGFLATAIVLHWRFNVLVTLLAAPIFVSSGIAFGVAVAVIAVARMDRTQPGRSFAERQRDAIRPLTFAVREEWEKQVAEREAEDSASQSFAAIYGLDTPKVSARLDRLLFLIRDSFILPWYLKISPSRAFPDAVERNIRHALSQVGRRAEVVDWPNLVVSRVLPIMTDHFQHYRSIEHLSNSIAATPSSSLPLPLPKNPHTALLSHNHISAESNIPSIEEHFRGIVERILQDVLPASEQSAVVSTIVREIVLGAILIPVFNMLCDSDFWNRQIDEQGGKYLHQRKQVNKVLSALSTLPAQASQTSSPARARSHRSATTITVHSTTRQFDEFMRSIPRLKTLGDARRLRSDVDRELRSARAGLNKARTKGNSDETQEAARKLVKYVDRLERARAYIDKRITALSGGVQSSPRSPAFPLETPATMRFRGNLYTILSDPSSLAYWLEYMERRDRSHLVQFWLTVEGFKDPLEASGQNLALENVTEGHDSRPSANDATIGDDTAFLYQTYFANPEHTIAIPSKVVAEIADLASHISPLSPADVRRAKRAVYQSQKYVYEQMELEDWPDFQKSELYIKAIADLKNAHRPRPVMRSVSDSPPASPAASLLSAQLPNGRRLSDNPQVQPHPPRRPYLLGGSFSPITAPTPSLPTVTPPQDHNTPMRKVTPESRSSGASPRTSPAPGIPSSPATSIKAKEAKTKNLEFLFGGTGADTDGSEERDPLFDGEEEDEATQLEAQRMEAIQAALNEIMSEDMRSSVDLTNLRPPAQTSSSPTMTPTDLLSPVQDPLTMSVELVRPERHPLAGNKLTSRSAEDLTALSGKASPPSPVRRVAQLDVAARKARRHRRGSIGNGLTHRSTKSIFADEEEEELVADAADPEDPGHVDVDVHLAAPGDMELSVEIGRLAGKITELDQQAGILNSLISQAELTGNQKELKLLHRSRSSLLREKRTAEFQKAQYEQQEEENRLVPGRTRVTIPSSLISPGDHEGGRQIVRYNVEIQQVGEDGRVVLSWVVTHRYNEFYELDRALHEWASTSNDPRLQEDIRKVVDLPGKRLVPNISANFVETRRAGLEKYLQSLLVSQRLCDSPIVRAFLSKSAPAASDLASSTGSLGVLAPANIVKSLYKTVASSLDEALVPSMLDLMSQSLSRQLQEVAGGIGVVTEAMPTALKVGGPWKSPTTAVTTLPALAVPPTLPANPPTMAIPGAMQPLEGETATMGSFTAPITDLFIEVFNLKEKDWLRRQAIVILLQQVLGGTIERKVRDAFRKATSEKGIDKLLRLFQDNMWPGGQRKPPTDPRTDKEKYDTRVSASRRLGLLMPDVAANMIGRSNARRAAGRMFGVLQDARLNQQLMLCIFDEVLGALFPPPPSDRRTMNGESGR